MKISRRKGIFCSWPLISNPTVQNSQEGTQAVAGRFPSSGTVDSIAGRKERAGVDGLLDSEHRFAKGKHHGVEEPTASSTRCFTGVEERRVGLAAHGKVLGLNWISNSAKNGV
jgi:hypothetical protein